MWSEKQINTMCEILELQAQANVSNLDLIVYEKFKFMVNRTEEGMNVDLDEACNELVESEMDSLSYNEEALEYIMRENWENPAVFENGI